MTIRYIHDDYMDGDGTVPQQPSRMHSLNRTSPKGGPFVGTCALCGKTGLTLDAMREECENPRGLTQAEAIVEAVEGPPPNYEKAAHFLFSLLDDIDTASDMAKGDDKAYREAVERIQRKRFEVATTNGYDVTFKG